MEPLDATERAVSFCSCGFSICRFCWKRLIESENGRCPHCREPYDENKISLKPAVIEHQHPMMTGMKQKRKKPDRKRVLKLTVQERKHLQELRILQRNLVYAVGLSLEICTEKVLCEEEFFGQFGAIKKISVNRSSPYSSRQSKNGPTGAAYVTFEHNESAMKCVDAIDGAIWDGHYIRACFGTTKYCQAFLKGAQCNNPDCLYMHHLVNEGTFTKEEMNGGATGHHSDLYNLINFDRSKGPVPGSLARPPKGPGTGPRREEKGEMEWAQGPLGKTSVGVPSRGRDLQNGGGQTLGSKSSVESVRDQLLEGLAARQPDRYVPPHEVEKLRETKSASPVVEDLLREKERIQEMLRRRTSVPEQRGGGGRALLAATSSRRGPPPGFEKLENRISETRSTGDLTAVATDGIKTLTQNMMESTKQVNFSPSMAPGGQTPVMDCSLVGQQFVGSLQSPFVGNGGGNTMISPSPNLGFPSLANNFDTTGNMTNNSTSSPTSLLQSLIAGTNSGLGILHEANSQQLSNQGSMPIMQNRLSADAIDREMFGIRGFSSTGLHYGETTTTTSPDPINEEAAEAAALHSILKLTETGGGSSNTNFVQDTNSTTTALHSDPSILAFKKPGDSEIVQQLSLQGNNLMSNNTTTTTTTMSPFDCTGIWSTEAVLPMTPFLASETAPLPPPGGSNASLLGNGQFNGQGNLHSMDSNNVSSFLYTDQISAMTRTTL
eukprot:g4348.t1